MENILTSLKREPGEAKEMLNEIGPSQEGFITFDEFVKLMDKIENRMDKKEEDEESSTKQKDSIIKNQEESEINKDGTKRTALLDFLVLLEDYRAK